VAGPGPELIAALMANFRSCLRVGHYAQKKHLLHRMVKEALVRPSDLRAGAGDRGPNGEAKWLPDRLSVRTEFGSPKCLSVSGRGPFRSAGGGCGTRFDEG